LISYLFTAGYKIYVTLAGLLTNLCFGYLLILRQQAVDNGLCSKASLRITAAGTVTDFQPAGGSRYSLLIYSVKTGKRTNVDTNLHYFYVMYKLFDV